VLKLLAERASDPVGTGGLSGLQERQINDILARPYGMLVISGPTGCRTTQAHRALGMVERHFERRLGRRPAVVAFGNPAEMPENSLVVSSGTATDQASHDATAQARNALRRPNIVAFGDIGGDPAMADLAFWAAATCHQVIVTIGVNGAFDTLGRFLDHRIPPEMVFDTRMVSGIVCQRLVSVTCPHCALPRHEAKQRGLLEPDLIRDVERIDDRRAKDVRVWRPEGCDACKGRGYQGRDIVAEIVPVDLTLMSELRSGRQAGARDRWLSELNGFTMLEHAVAKMFTGRFDPSTIEDRVGDLSGFNPSRVGTVGTAKGRRPPRLELLGKPRRTDYPWSSGSGPHCCSEAARILLAGGRDQL
jgi:type II secretory ATPase GspE/PulE/Tfp pilus assembly ATPase PilB-like protein